LNASLTEVISAVSAQGLEGVVAKNLVCEPSRKEIRALGVGPHSGENEGLPMAEA
jgi:hypothetical protein